MTAQASVISGPVSLKVPTRDIHVKGSDPHELTFDLEAASDSIGIATLQFIATYQDYQDSIELSLPVEGLL